MFTRTIKELTSLRKQVIAPPPQDYPRLPQPSHLRGARQRAFAESASHLIADYIVQATEGEVLALASLPPLPPPALGPAEWEELEFFATIEDAQMAMNDNSAPGRLDRSAEDPAPSQLPGIVVPPTPGALEEARLHLVAALANAFGSDGERRVAHGFVLSFGRRFFCCVIPESQPSRTMPQ